jgi:hypothetical protein
LSFCVYPVITLAEKYYESGQFRENGWAKISKSKIDYQKLISQWFRLEINLSNG